METAAAGSAPRVLTALVSPFDERGHLDLATAGALARRLCARGSDGFVLAGTTGESPTLGAQEKLALCAAVRSAVDGQAQVWLGTGGNDTAASCELTAAAAAAGAQGVMAVVPYYSRPPQQGLLAHFQAIARSTPLPVMVYNIPARTGCNLLPQTLGALKAACPNLWAIKEASRDLEQVGEICRLLPEFVVYSGDDALTLPVLALGGRGVVSVASHLVPERIALLVASALRGEWELARRTHLGLLPLYRALFLTTNPIPVKVALRQAGFPVGGFRRPLCEPTEAEAAQIRAVVREHGLDGSLRV